MRGPLAHATLDILPGRLAQLGERRLDKAEVTGSSPVSPMETIAIGSIGTMGVLQRIAVNAPAGIRSIEPVTSLSALSAAAD